jgi:ceramide glucosyltransferase
MISLFTYPGWACETVALAGAGYAMLASALAARFRRREQAPLAAAPAVTILKPLHGAEPDLSRNLETFFTQDYPAPVQIVFGVSDRNDPALAVVRALEAKYPHRDTAIVADPARHGANAKVSNLINMMAGARHDVLVLSDSDISVRPDWLRQVTAALAQPGVGVVTCLYTGEPAQDGRQPWSSLAAMGTSYDFLPNAMVGVSLGLATPCFGSTIALTRRTLEEAGGFAAFADQLADDYEMGRAVRARGHALAIPPLGVGHTAAETRLLDLVRHELRWARTIRMVDPAGHLGSFVTHTFAFALIGAALLHFNAVSLAALAVALGTRLFLKFRIDGIFGTHAGPFWLLPVRDLLSFAVFAASLFGERVHWRGSDFAVEPSGAMSRI